MGDGRTFLSLFSGCGGLDLGFAEEGFQCVLAVDNDEAALEAARKLRPHLALIEPELSGSGGWWVIQQIQAEHLAAVVVALGQRANGVLAQLVGAQTYVQMGTSPRDLLSALEAAISNRASAGSNGSAAEAKHDLLSDAHFVL